jgi:3,4-dihydroxy 2-butanone 4-phosphate synthase/GTP cyclohydrolase II
VNIFNTIEEAIQAIRNGEIVIIVDDKDRENEGDFVAAAELATPEMINFMATQGRGLICAPLSQKRARQLNLNLMTSNNTSEHETAFTISVDAANGGTGISAVDRALTVNILANETLTEKELRKPGHIFPLIAKDGGVLVRPGHTEASVDLCRLSQQKECAVICEIINLDGQMARENDLFVVAKEFNLKIISINQLIDYRIKTESLVESTAQSVLPTKFGEFELNYFERKDRNEHCVVLKTNNFNPDNEVLVRVHSECLTSEVFGSLKCDCAEQLSESMKNIFEHGNGLIIYLKQEGRGIGLKNKIKAYKLQEEGFDTVEANLHLGLKADAREYSMAYQVLKYYSCTEIVLLTNNPNKVEQLESFGVKVLERKPLVIESNLINQKYFHAKQERMGHIYESH